MITRPGIYPDMSCEDYFADPCPAPSLTQSLAKLLIARSPLHAKCAHPRLRDTVVEVEPESYEKAKAIGNAVHRLMIGRGKDLVIADFDSWRSKDAKSERDDAVAAGMVPILRHHFDVATAMVAAGREQLEHGGYGDAFDIGLGQGEVCVAWEEDGFWFRTLIDWLPDNRAMAWDYKTTEMSVAPHSIGCMMVDAGWDIQAAMHERGLRHFDVGLHQVAQRNFRFVAQEQEEPYALIVAELPDEVMDLGRRKLQYAVDLWRRSMSTGLWPGYSLDLQHPTYPAWAESAWLNREIHEAAQERQGERGNVLLAG